MEIKTKNFLNSSLFLEFGSNQQKLYPSLNNENNQVNKYPKSLLINNVIKTIEWDKIPEISKTNSKYYQVGTNVFGVAAAATFLFAPGLWAIGCPIVFGTSAFLSSRKAYSIDSSRY